MDLAVTNTPEIDFLLHEIASDNAAINSITSHKKDYMIRLQFLIGDATVILEGDMEAATWNEIIRDDFDARALMKDHPKLYKKYLKKNVSKRLVIKKVW